MTDTNTLADIANEIESLDADFAKVNATIDLIGKPAVLKANEIATALKAVKEKFSTALADQAMLERVQRLSRFSDIRVDYTLGDNLISTAFTIRYKQDAYDHNLHMTVPQGHTCSGFSALADAAYEYLVTVKPEAIPAEIMALAPGRPQDAMAIYLAGKARGYFKGAAASA